MRRIVTVALLLAAGAAQADVLSGAPMPPGIELRALVTDARVDEISGIAASRRHPGVFWVLNDSDRPAEVYALDSEGTVRATIVLAGTRNVDWEDITLFETDGKTWLMIADTGDNGGLRRDLALHFIEEPAQLADATLPVARTLRFRWPDGPRDCEASAVDVRRGDIYLVSKKRVPPELFRLPLMPADDTVQIAERIGALHGIEQPTSADLERNPVYGRYRSQITGIDISADGRFLAALNYRRIYLWGAHPAGWADAVAAPAKVIEFPWIPQAEAIGFDPGDDALWISSERLPAPLMRLALPTD